MKLKAILPAIVFAVVSAFSMTAFSADAEKAPAKKMKPHSHMEEKIGTPQSDAQSEKKAAKPKAKTDQHLHPRDGK